MDLIKIGAYIAGKRKALCLTQKQLAEKLGMSDKSVSKWERGVCLPDVSVYSELCEILGISINEFLAGEDIPSENLIRKSEENLIGVTTAGKQKQSRLKAIICVLSVLTVSILITAALTAYHKNRPQNYIAPLARDSIEMETASLFAGPDGAYIYNFTTSSKYRQLKLYISTYNKGQLLDKENIALGFESTASPENGSILVFPDFENFIVRIVISAGGGKLSGEIPILEGVENREYYGRSATEIQGKNDIIYDKEQPLVALIYDNDTMRVIDIYDMIDGETNAIQDNDYVYYFSFEFFTQ